MFEPANQPGGCHIIEDHFIEQVIDPNTGLELPYGESGEHVTTSFGRSIIPLIRYRTADRVTKVPASTAANGRTWDLYEGGILGRVDDMKLVRGTNVYMRAVEGIIRTFPGVEEYQVKIIREGIRDEIILATEISPSVTQDAWADMSREMSANLADAHEGLRFIVERARPGSLPRFGLKAKRLVDTRA